MTVSSQIITDKWDPQMGVLLSPDLDKHYNHVELSFYFEVVTPLCLIIQYPDRLQDVRAYVQIKCSS